MPLVLDGTNGVSGVDGTASNPAIEGTDSNTGIFYPAADTVAIGTGGTEALRVNSSQQVGIGATPSTWTIFKALEVGAAGTGLAGAAGQPVLFSNCYYNGGWKYAANGFAANYDQSSGQHRWFNAASGTAGNAITFTQAMTLDASGRLIVGTTTAPSSTDVKLFVNSSGGGFAGFAANGTAGSAVGSPTTSTLAFYTAAGTLGAETYTERARITSDGFFKAQANSTYVGSTSAYHEFITASGNQNTAKFRSNATNGQQYGIEITTANDQNDAVRSFIQCAGAATVRAEMRSNGGLANYSANNVNLASDQRLKKDISLLDTSWDKVKQIEVVNFRYKDCNEGDPLLYGVIAQQVQPIVPELVVVTQEAKEATEDAEATPEYYGIREQPMYWLAIKALQEAMTRIEQLEAKVAALESA